MKQLSLSPFCPRKLSVEWEIKPSSDFLVLKVMATKKRSNNLFFFFRLLWMESLSRIILHNGARTKPFFKKSGVLGLLHRFHSVSTLSWLFHKCDNVHYLKNPLCPPCL